jgi:hypothetical protein
MGVATGLPAIRRNGIITSGGAEFRALRDFVSVLSQYWRLFVIQVAQLLRVRIFKYASLSNWLYVGWGTDWPDLQKFAKPGDATKSSQLAAGNDSDFGGASGSVRGSRKEMGADGPCPVARQVRKAGP